MGTVKAGATNVQMEGFPAKSRETPHEQGGNLSRPADQQNRGGDFTNAPRCGAKNRQGLPCKAPAMRGKRRCRLHGGKSTGARTKAGIQRIRQARWKDGLQSARLQAECRAHFPGVPGRVRGICRDGPPAEWGEEC